MSQDHPATLKPSDGRSNREDESTSVLRQPPPPRKAVTSHLVSPTVNNELPWHEFHSSGRASIRLLGHHMTLLWTFQRTATCKETSNKSPNHHIMTSCAG